MAHGKFLAMIGLSAATLVAGTALPALAGQPHVQEGRWVVGNNRGAVAAVVSGFERAYMNKDKKIMILKLMVPTSDADTLEKRYQWLRGYGPHDMPGTVHPPILFKTTKGSFVPTRYSILEETPIDKTHWIAKVQEKGTYHDEDGSYHVNRTRYFKVVKYTNGKWYVADYYVQG